MQDRVRAQGVGRRAWRIGQGAVRRAKGVQDRAGRRAWRIGQGAVRRA